MKDCVAKLTFDDFSTQVLRDARLQQGQLKDLIDTRTPARVDRETHAQQTLQLAAVGADWGVDALYDFETQPCQTGRFERRLQRTHFVEHHAERPHVRSAGVGLVLNDFW